MSNPWINVDQQCKPNIKDAFRGIKDSRWCRRTCSHPQGSAAGPGEDQPRSRIPVELLRNSNHKNAFNVASCQKSPSITLHSGDSDVPRRDSFNAPGGEFRLLSVPDRGDSVVCSWWTVRQSDRASWVAEDFIWEKSTQVLMNMLYIKEHTEALHSLIHIYWFGRQVFFCSSLLIIRACQTFWVFSFFNNMTMYNMNSICVIILTAYVIQKCTGSLYLLWSKIPGTAFILMKSPTLTSFSLFPLQRFMQKSTKISEGPSSFETCTQN